ncbi:hemerythrin domain-containing protein [Nocardia miyunensis]|uniref:hemerythrin domain-containing protein n=1 Tax=Nocardia miyunensis TaxID=282684 RepID=UPI000831C3F1|nr:hemerythrin domain-containing protein [Nocardia miyunensis]
MDVLTVLLADHNVVLRLLRSLERAPREVEQARADLVTSLVITESGHEAVEEQYFWPLVRKMVPDGDVLADHAIEQEKTGKYLLRRLEDGPVGSPEFEEALATFVPAAREHINFEQTRVWPLLRQFCSTEQLEVVGEKMAAARKLAPTRPHPKTPAHPVVQKAGGMAVAALDRVRDLVTARRNRQPSGPWIRDRG